MYFYSNIRNLNIDILFKIYLKGHVRKKLEKNFGNLPGLGFDLHSAAKNIVFVFPNPTQMQDVLKRKNMQIYVNRERKFFKKAF